MSHAAEVAIAATPTQVWRVLADIEAWPSWSASFAAIEADDTASEPSAYRVDQPPLPHALWTITDWQPERGFTWQTRGASSLLAAEFTVTTRGSATHVTQDLHWSGPMAWMARATYGPVGLRYADEHLRALAQRCDGGRKP